jgi:hypothetical protein
MFHVVPIGVPHSFRLGNDTAKHTRATAKPRCADGMLRGRWLTNAGTTHDGQGIARGISTAIRSVQLKDAMLQQALLITSSRSAGQTIHSSTTQKTINHSAVLATTGRPAATRRPA